MSSVFSHTELNSPSTNNSL